MTDEPITEYGNWQRIDPVWPDFQLAVVRNSEAEQVLAVEHAPGHAPWDRGKPYQVVILEEDYYDNHEVVEYLAKGVSKQEAYRVATIHIEEHA